MELTQKEGLSPEEVLNKKKKSIVETIGDLGLDCYDMSNEEDVLKWAEADNPIELTTSRSGGLQGKPENIKFEIDRIPLEKMGEVVQIFTKQGFNVERDNESSGIITLS